MKVFLTFIILINATVYATELQKRESMNIHSATLWQLIETLINQPPFTLDTIKQKLPVDFSKNGDNGYFSFYESSPLHLMDKVAIKKFSLSIGHKNRVSIGIGIDIDPDGICVTVDDIFAHYPDIIIVGAPRGDSLDESTFWAIQKSWGRLAFGFKVRNPRCLSHIAIVRNEP